MKWSVAYCKNKQYRELKTAEEIRAAGLPVLPAQVPGCLEQELMRAGIVEDLFFSDNVYRAQELENLHALYFTTFEIRNEREYLHFEGIDTVADIYVNGELVRSVDNMFLSYDVFAPYRIGKNEVVVHIKPAVLEARRFVASPAVGECASENNASLYVRKAAHSYGWDIMPRILTAGLWKPVSIRERQEEGIREAFLYTSELHRERGARLRLYASLELSGDFAREYTLRIRGKCGEHTFSESFVLWHNTEQRSFWVRDPQLWWPKNYGAPALYDVELELLCGERVIDRRSWKTGIRTARLIRTEVSDKSGNGKFHFEVNGKRIFVMGTNWVPLDAIHARDAERLPAALALLDDIGCNAVRCWGGNVYESDAFFDFCDAHGILVWQDFAMACAIYPQDDDFARRLGEEAVFQIKRLRNHPSLALWVGDNECDAVYMHWRLRDASRDPNENRLTRAVLPQAVRTHDPSRDYLPSSPYVSPTYIQRGAVDELPENHLWGPRDYFKGSFYRDTFCHFASEIGYHGFPSPQSLARFLREPGKMFEEDGYPTWEYAAHATASDRSENGRRQGYTYRIRLANDQVKVLFSKKEEELAAFARQSQISQAEAKKYFIEKFRIDRKRRSGIIWWNLLDGWPQISDAVVDYYGTRKLAYHFIKRSQEPVCLMCDEPVGKSIALVAANELDREVSVTWRVTSVTRGECVSEGQAVLGADSATRLATLPYEEGRHEMLLIEWEREGKAYRNHYYTCMKNVDLAAYLADLEKCGFAEWEGFDA